MCTQKSCNLMLTTTQAAVNCPLINLTDKIISQLVFNKTNLYVKISIYYILNHLNVLDYILFNLITGVHFSCDLDLLYFHTEHL